MPNRDPLERWSNARVQVGGVQRIGRLRAWLDAILADCAAGAEHEGR